MRIVHTADELLESVEAAQREALGGFGDATVFLERYVPRARHIEIQILGDTHGNLVHLGERECSIQRRHQKVVEEAPSPVVDAEMRAAMGEAALSLARRLGYVSAGTVEFLVDDAPGPDGRRPFYFLEVNTRLQVEHPVTEAVTGLDLVREQLRIAAGEPLGYAQGDVTLTGHAVEVRLYAEDPANGFLPATGTLSAYVPAADPAVRWDAGVHQGSVVGTSFDPMLAKVIAHAGTRTEAALRLALALERTHLGGVITNRDFLVATLRHDAYLAGDTTTAFIDEHAPARVVVPGPERLARVAAAVALWVQGTNRASARVLEYLPSGWRNARMPDERVALDLGGERIEVRYRIRRDGRFGLGDGATATIHAWSPDGIDATVGDRRVRLRITRGGSAGPGAGDRLYVHDGAGDLDVVVLPRFTVPGSDAPTGGLTAPMPGKVLDVRVATGDTVTAGQVLLILEAMKMEHRITAPTDGTVTTVSVAAGDQVERGAALLHVEEAG
jgi:propionyl-CoA carboxylase alpha chain